MLSPRDPLTQALAVPGNLRTRRDLQPIIEFVRGLKFFHSFSQYPHTVEQIAMHLELHTFEQGEFVFREGEQGDRFYIVLDGEISIMKKKRVHSLVDFVTENVILVKLGCGKYFGETALESQEGLRTASAIASKNSNLLSLNRNDYQSILMGLKILLRSAVKRILSSPSSIFYHLSSDILDKLSEVIVMRTFTLHEEIFLAGEKVNSLYIVKTGLVKLIKPISSLHMANVLAEVDKKYAPPEVKTFAHSHNNNDNNHTTTNNYNRPQRPVTTGAHHLVFKLSIFNITMILVVTVTLKIAIMIWIFILSIRLLILRQLLI